MEDGANLAIQTLLLLGRHAPGRDHNDRQISFARVANAFEHLKAAHSGHDQVQQDQTYLRMHGQELQCFPSAAGGNHLEAGPLEGDVV